MSASAMASRRAGSRCASTSAPACGSTAASPAASRTTTMPTASSLRRRSSSLDSKACSSSSCRASSIGTSAIDCALRTGGAARFAGLAAERRRPHRSASSSSSTKADAFGGLGGGSSSKKKKGPVVVIDNYDSFTYNLCQYLGDLGCDYVVVANDACSVADIAAMNPAGVLVSPGPGAPEESGISLEAVAELGPRFPLLGVCMGHQCIGRAFGGRVVRAPGGVMHGKTSPVEHGGVGLLRGLPSPFLAARYHSLVIESDSCPACLEVTARTQGDGVIMAVRHRDFPWVQGVQFHPESIITDGGMAIVKNFVDSLEAGVGAGAGAGAEQGSEKVAS